jgi:hypothetical protein
MTFFYALVPLAITVITCVKLWRQRQFGFDRDLVFVAAGWALLTAIIVLTAFIKEVL